MKELKSTFVNLHIHCALNVTKLRQSGGKEE